MRFVYLTFTLLVSNALLACDICGCAPGTGYLGVLPQFDRNIFGVRLNYTNFVHPSTNFNSNDIGSTVLEDRFYRTDFWLRYYPLERLQMIVNVPYAVSERIETNRTTAISGIGDISMDLNYTLIDYGDSITSDWKNLLLVGGGIALPTGKYQQRDDTRLMLPAEFQVGSGAYAYSLGLIHTLRYRTWGLNTNLRYQFRGTNELSYDYGNQFNGAMALFYWGEVKKFSFLPSTGVRLDHFQKDYQYESVRPQTGGAIMNFTAGLDLYIGRFLINSFIQVPFWQDIPSEQPANNFNVGAGVSIFLGKNE